MSDIADIVGKDQIDREFSQGTIARPSIESVNYVPKVFNPKEANGDISKKNKIPSNIKRLGGAIVLTGALLLAGLTYKGLSYEVQPNMTVSHFARGHDIPTPTLMTRNGLEYPEQLQAGSVFYVYHPGFKGIFENVYDYFKNIIDK